MVEARQQLLPPLRGEIPRQKKRGLAAGSESRRFGAAGARSTEQPLTKGLSVQRPTTVFTKPNEVGLKSAVLGEHGKSSDKKRPELREADLLVQCVQNFYKRACKVMDGIQSNIPSIKSPASIDLNSTNNVLDSILYLTSSIGAKWGSLNQSIMTRT
ncbi:hypothetical protein WN55_00216 [Dufourea novaeangliae]|uniref:Uncharacterized protein n=1 Tax=Dufourea novaeangliae TaxID=178035 RepID=A0A154PDS9_DUFNO|nr:hypothetical protein WN55_00216 [Dufourea novaeangliae]